MKYILGPVFALPCLLLLAGCESEPAKKQAAASPPPQAAAPANFPKQPEAAPGPSAAFAGYHRYRGTVGSQPVTLELTLAPANPSPDPRYLGSYFYDRHGAPLDLLSQKPFRPDKPLYLTERDSAATGHWQALQPAGPQLSGTWFGARGRQLPFVLREDYAGAVRYELLTETLQGARCNSQGPEKTLQVSRDFLHLLGPDTLQPGLRRLQCPGPARRRTQVQAELAETSCEAETYGYFTDIAVRLNGYGLLSLVTTELEDLGGAYPSGPTRLQTYDLSTGRPCVVGQWLRPEQEQQLRQLLSRQLVKLEYPLNLTAPGEPDYQKELPDFGLNSEGLYCVLGDFGAPHVAQRQEVTVAYPDLYPCVQPGTPLMRLMQARGLRPRR